jgi:hypothetical protein
MIYCKAKKVSFEIPSIPESMIKKSLISESECQKSHHAVFAHDTLQTIGEAEVKLEGAHLDIIKKHFQMQEAREQLELK